MFSICEVVCFFSRRRRQTRWNCDWSSGVCSSDLAVAFVGFLEVRSLEMLFGTALVFGYSYGAISTLFPAIVGDFFGRGQAGALVGFLFAFAGAMAGRGGVWAERAIEGRVRTGILG